MSIGKLGWTVAECYERPRDCTAQFTEPAAIRAAGRGDGRNQRRRYAWERAEDRNISSEGDTRGNARRTETEAARVLSGAKVRVGDNIHDGGSPPRGFTPPLGSVGSRRQRRQEAWGQVSKGKGTEERTEIGRLPRHKEVNCAPQTSTVWSADMAQGDECTDGLAATKQKGIGQAKQRKDRQTDRGSARPKV
jgi:hypothetical protein